MSDICFLLAGKSLVSEKILNKGLATYDLNFSWGTFWLAKRNQYDTHSF